MVRRAQRFAAGLLGWRSLYASSRLHSVRPPPSWAGPPAPCALPLAFCYARLPRSWRFDQVAARRASDLDAVDVPGSACVVDGVKLREVRFSSRQWRLEPSVIRIQAFVAVPLGSFPLHTSRRWCLRTA